MRLLESIDVDLDGRHAVVVVGRSELVGRPMAQLLLERHATVTTFHSRTRELASLTRQADVLIVAAGVPGLVGAEHVARGAVVVDLGMHRVAGRLQGDVRTRLGNSPPRSRRFPAASDR